MPLSCLLLLSRPWYLWTYATALGIYCLCAGGVRPLAHTSCLPGCAALGVYVCLLGSPWHVPSVRWGVQPFACTVCSRGCAALGMYFLLTGVCSPSHVLSVRGGVRPLACISVNWGVQPFACTVCSRGVCGPRHVLSVNWGVQPFVCTVCSRGCAALRVYRSFARVCGPPHVPCVCDWGVRSSACTVR